MHVLYSGLISSGNHQAQAAAVALGKVRRWLIHGDSPAAPVRGAGYVCSDGEVWMAYTPFPSPALVRGSYSQLDELRRYLAIASRPDYDGSPGARADPTGALEYDSGIVLRSPAGVVRLNEQATLDLEHWLSATLVRRDRRGVVCLPGAWQRD